MPNVTEGPDQAIKSLGERLRFLRQTLGRKRITLVQMADFMRIHREPYRAYESRHVMPGADKLISLFYALERHYPERTLNVDWLLMGRGRPYLEGARLVLRDRTIVAASPAVQDLTGWPLNRIIGKDTQDYMPLDAERTLAKLPLQKRMSYTTVILGPGKSRIDVDVDARDQVAGAETLRVLDLRLTEAQATVPHVPGHVAASA